MIKFSDAVQISRTSCKRCLALIYKLPCRVDRNIVAHLKSFGKPLYPLGAVKLLRIDASDGHQIESKLGKNAIKFAIPKAFEGTELDKTTRKLEFELHLAAWISEALDIPIITAEQDENNEG